MHGCRKHSKAMIQQGLANSSARLFSNPAGDYGSMVNERVGSSEWEDGSELGDTWASRNAFSYGRQACDNSGLNSSRCTPSCLTDCKLGRALCDVLYPFLLCPVMSYFNKTSPGMTCWVVQGVREGYSPA